MRRGETTKLWGLKLEKGTFNVKRLYSQVLFEVNYSEQGSKIWQNGKKLK